MLTHRLNTIFFIVVVIGLIVLSFFRAIAWWYFLVPVLLWFFITAAGSVLIRWNYHLKAYCRQKKPDGNQIAITFDDGPTPYTEKVLDLLAKYNAKATFFCIGRQIDLYPEIFKRIVNEGHTVSNHTYNHASNIGFYPKERMVEELMLTDAAIERYSGKKALLFRPPFGVTNPNIARAVKTTGHYVIGWNVRSLDTIIKDEAHILSRITNSLAPGSIVLLHDTTQKTVNVLEQLLVFLKQNKYELVTVDQLLKIPPYEE